MTTSLFTALDQLSYSTDNMPKKLTKFSLRDLQEVYVPAQPVLSCRTLDIDQPGTRTYRQKSNLDIIDAHQRLIRRLYYKPRSTASAPPRERRDASLSRQPPHEHNVTRSCHIEVKGRPVNSGLTFSLYEPLNKTSLIPQQRPRTTGQVKTSHSLTNSCLNNEEDEDLTAISQSNFRVNNQLHSYWKSDKNILNTGQFVRGQKHTVNIPSTIDSWLSFGGADENKEGVINAFTRIGHSEDYYNIEGSVGSWVARQLQRGGSVRVGINGVLQTQDLKVKKWTKDKVRLAPHNLTSEIAKDKIEDLTSLPEELTEQSLSQDETLLLEQQKLQETEDSKEETEIDFPLFGSHLEDDFKELNISSFDDFEENSLKPNTQKPAMLRHSDVHVDQKGEDSGTNEESVPEDERQTAPLSWSDQCSKPDIKIIYARESNMEPPKPVVSETFPVKFEKLTDGNFRPKLLESRPDFDKTNQKAYRISKESTSRVKHVSINPKITEEVDKYSQLTIQNIISHKVEETNKEAAVIFLKHDNNSNKNEQLKNINFDQNIPFHTRRNILSKCEPRTNFSSLYSNLLTSHFNNHSSRMIITPFQSSTNGLDENLRVLSAGSQKGAKNKELLKTSKSLGKLAPAKPLHRTVACQGSSFKTGASQKDRNYIKITTQLKIAGVNTPVVNLSHRVPVTNIARNSNERDTPQDLDYQFMDKINFESDSPASSTTDLDIDLTSIMKSSKKPLHSPDTSLTNTAFTVPVIEYNNNSHNQNSPTEVLSPASSSAPINIPTGLEKSFTQLSLKSVVDVNETT